MLEPVTYALNAEGRLVPRTEVLAECNQAQGAHIALNHHGTTQESDLGPLHPNISKERQSIIRALKRRAVPMSVTDIENETGYSGSSLRKMLAAMSKERQIKRIKRGLYQAVAE